MNQNSSSPLVSVPTSVTTSVTISNNYEYFGFRAYVHKLVTSDKVVYLITPVEAITQH